MKQRFGSAVGPMPTSCLSLYRSLTSLEFGYFCNRLPASD